MDSTSADRGCARPSAKLLQALCWARAIGRRVKEEHPPEKLGRILCKTVHDGVGLAGKRRNDVRSD